MGASKAWVEYLKWAVVLVVLAAPILLVPLRQAQFLHGAAHGPQSRFAASGTLKQVELRAFAK